MTMDYHPLADIFPLIDGAEFDALVADIREHGQREPIWLADGKIIDGRNRYRACLKIGADPRFQRYLGEDLVAFVISMNLRRRHLDESQRAMVAAKLATLPKGANQHSSIELPSQARASDMLNVGVASIKRARDVLDHGAPELQKAVEAGKVSVSAAADVASLPAEEQQEIVAKGEKEILDAAKAIRARKAEERRTENVSLAAARTAIPAGKFGTIVIDPPWEMQKIERDVRPNQFEFDYPTMNDKELAEFGCNTMLPIAADDCHLFCWTTQKNFPLALSMVQAWQFRYVLTMVWHKPGGFQPIGLPQYNCEFIIYARRGSPVFVDTKAFNCCNSWPRREHSRKPDEFYDLIRRVTGGSRIDVFSREKRDGFAQFGNEISKFDGAQ